MWMRLGDEAHQAVFSAHEAAVLQGSDAVEPEHFLLAFAEMPWSSAMRMLESASVTGAAMRDHLTKLASGYPRLSKRPIDMALAAKTKRIIDLAYTVAKSREDGMVGTEHLLLAIVKDGTGPGAGFLIESGANLARLQEALAELR